MQLNPKPAKRLRVLLVDDSPERRASVQQSLAEVGCEVVGFAASSDDLLQHVQQLNPEVVIIDLEAPGRDTLESLHSVQSAAPRPIVMFTQDDNGETITRATRAGVSASSCVAAYSRRIISLAALTGSGSPSTRKSLPRLLISTPRRRSSWRRC